MTKTRHNQQQQRPASIRNQHVSSEPVPASLALDDEERTTLAAEALQHPTARPLREAAVQRMQHNQGNHYAQHAIAARPTEHLAQRDTPGAFNATNVADPLNTRAALTQMLQQQEAKVRAWIQRNGDDLSHRLLSGMAGLVMYVKEGTPEARTMPDEQVRNLLTDWASSRHLVIPAISMFGVTQTRTLAAPPESNDDDAHLGIDLSSDGRTYAITVVVRNVNAHTWGRDRDMTALDLLHEPNVSIQFQPDAPNQAVIQAAISLLNLHLRRHGNEFIEASLGVQGSANTSDGTTSGAAQAQVELHLSTSISLTASTSASAARHSDDPPDPGSKAIGTAHGVDYTWQPITIGTLIHF